MDWRGRRWKAWAWFGAVALFAAASALDPSGVRRYLHLRDEVRAIEKENDRLAAENARLASEARALETDPAALERAAREELRFVRPDERVYWLGSGPGVAP